MRQAVVERRALDPCQARQYITALEAAGYVVRKPSEVELPVVIEPVLDDERFTQYSIAVRADCKINGKDLCWLERFPIDLVLSQDDEDFRANHLPRIIARSLADFISDGMVGAIKEQVKEKIDPLVPEKKMSLEEIVSFIAAALGTSKHRIDPQHFDERDRRR